MSNTHNQWNYYDHCNRNYRELLLVISVLLDAKILKHKVARHFVMFDHGSGWIVVANNNNKVQKKIFCLTTLNGVHSSIIVLQ